MKRKGLLKVVGIVGAFTMAMSLFAGCTAEKSEEDRAAEAVTNYGYDTICYNKPIVVNEGGKYILHVGEVRVPHAGYGRGGVSHTPKLVLKCGDVLRTSQFVAYENTMPTSDCYDEVCDCAKNSLFILN